MFSRIFLGKIQHLFKTLIRLNLALHCSLALLLHQSVSSLWHIVHVAGVTCKQTPWPHRNHPLLLPWRAINPASPRRSWVTSWRTSTCATAATTYSDDRFRLSVDIASAPTASTGLWGGQQRLNARESSRSARQHLSVNGFVRAECCEHNRLTWKWRANLLDPYLSSFKIKAGTSACVATRWRQRAGFGACRNLNILFL